MSNAVERTVAVHPVRLTDYADVYQVLRSRQFVSRGRVRAREFMSGSLITLDGDEHLARRRLYRSIFDDNHLAALEETLFEPMIKGYLSHHLSVPDKSRWASMDLVPYTEELSLRVGAEIVGLDELDDEPRRRRLHELLVPISAGIAVDSASTGHNRILEEGRNALETFRKEFFLPSWERRGREVRGHRMKGDEPGGPFVDVLGSLRSQWNDGWDDALPLRISATILTAAFGNPARQIVHAVDDLLGWADRYPEMKHLLQRDEFLRHAIDETLRLHVTGTPILVRHALEPVTLPSGAQVSAGHDVELDLTAANRDPEVFGEDSQLFDPYRYGRLPTRVKPYGVAFGAGAHVCIGRTLAIGRNTESGHDGFQLLAIRNLMRWGVRRHPDRAARRATTGLHYYETYPIELTIERLSEEMGLASNRR